MHSIRVKITAITIAAILTTILSVFAACFSTVRIENDQSSVEKMNLIGDDTNKSLEMYFDSIEQSTEMAANIASDRLDSVMLVECGAAGAGNGTKGRTKEQTDRLDAYLKGYSDSVQEAFSSVASHTSGVISYYYCFSPSISESVHGFFYSKVGKTGFSQREPLDARELDPEDLSHTTWYYTPIRRGRPSWVGPYAGFFTNEMVICSYLVPIYKAGTLIGVLGMDIPFETLTSLVSSIRVYDTGFACLLDDEGRVVYHPTLEAGSTIEQSGLPLKGDEFKKEKSGSEQLLYTVDGEKRQMSFTTLSNGMKLVITAPESEINASWMRLVRIVLFVTAAAIVFFAILVRIVMGVITRPLQRLTAASKRLAAADYDVELRYESLDEVGVLTSAFRQMRDQIKLYVEDLNRRICTDALTGLPNMEHFFELAEQERLHLLEAGKHPVMLYFNLVGLKHYNRQYSFREGNRLLCDIAGILSRRYGEKCSSRFGQDHFAAVTHEEGLEEGLREVIREARGANGGRSLPVRIGIYQDSLDIVDASTACDHAKYACDLYRGSFVSGFNYFDAKMLKNAENVRYIISHLDQALRERWIKVHYQPIVRAVNGRVCDEEALARWVDPVRGMLSPGDFITILENARLIYQVDLYVLDRTLEKIRLQAESGLTIVPHSINLSRSDFDACDMVEEIRRRVDEAGIPRDRITIEITESILGRDSEFMREQVIRFQELGFPVWMDDFGSGYSSLDVLHTIKFDLIKFDMSFLKRLNEGDEGKIILTEMMKMATELGVDTVCEGVETLDQMRFLQEIGCSKLQGYYFCKPIPLEEIIERYEKGIQIGYENPKESSYYEAVCRANLFDAAVIADEGENTFRNIFDAIPMCVMEVWGSKMRYLRSNESYREFVRRFLDVDLQDPETVLVQGEYGSGSDFMEMVKQCCSSEGRIFFDEQTPDGSIIHSFMGKIGVNPVNGRTAVAVAVLSISEMKEGTTYAAIARTLASDYYNIYYVDLITEHFIEYASHTSGLEPAVERHGEKFFNECRDETRQCIFGEDEELFLSSFTKENILRVLDEEGVFRLSYRLGCGDEPSYVTMKISRIVSDENHIIVGISDSDPRMKELMENQDQ